MYASEGDSLVVASRRVGRAARIGRIVEVLGTRGSPPYRVQWSDDPLPHIVVPGSDAVIHQARD
ncbi:MAG: DUF1918 domain-containing protein [Acidimicrobiia bacterium]|nr:DUF1918 domain-containing protein [Acidimicrobiia bacterium]MDH5519039.1 DUF1918 domain-containing protein [Acidimicrobiia bacterium]